MREEEVEWDEELAPRPEREAPALARRRRPVWFALFGVAAMVGFLARMIWISFQYGWDLAP